jgi:hypothetical protein
MQYINRFNLLPQKSEAFRDWLRENDKLLREGTPEGWQYLGTWFTVRNFGRYDCEMRYELDNYAALGADFGSDALQQAWREIFDSFAPNQGETYLMKSSEDVIIMKGA